MNIKQIKYDLLRLQNETNNKYWNIGPETGKYLQQIIIKNSYKKILEIGTSNGLSGLYIIEALLNNKGKLVTIEINESRYNEAKNNFKQAGVGNYVCIFKGHSSEVLESINENFDLIFIDCGKKDYLPVYKKIRNKLSLNGKIICDNVISHKKELTSFINYLETEKDIIYEIIKIELGLIKIENILRS